MSLSRPQAGASANATSVAITSTAQGDLILVFAYNKTNATIPTLPAGFTTVLTATTTNGACRVGYKQSPGTDTSSGTWTNATSVVCLVFRSSLGIAAVGASLSTTGSGTTLTWLSFAAANGGMQFRTDGASWVAGFGGARSATAGMDGNTTGGANNLTNETSQTTANGLDTEAAVAAFGTDETLAVTTTGEWLTATVEVLEPAGELPGNPTAGVGMHAQARQNVRPGYLRKVRLAGADQYEQLAGVFAHTIPQARAAEGTTGVNFGMTIGKRTDVGSPSASSQLQHGPGRILMLVPVSAGARTVSVDARWWPDSGAGQRPRLVVKRDLEIGVQADISAEADASTEPAFTTIALDVTVAVDGVLECYREQQDTRQDAWTLWDNLAVT